MPHNNLSLSKAILIFTGFTAYFYLLLFTLLPFLKNNFSFNPALYWFITGHVLFIPLFAFAVVMTIREGYTGMSDVLKALNVKPLSKTDWKYSVAGLVIVFIASGLIFGVSILSTKLFGIRELSTTPWFMEMRPFQGSEKLLLLVWLPMFFFNIVGEEILWRGYIQTRLQSKYSWVACSVLWLLFHLPFGFGLMILLVPVIVIIPYVYSKTLNTANAVFIHGMYNGPMFVMVALGVIQ